MNLKKLIFPDKRDLRKGMTFKLKPENDYSDFYFTPEDVLYTVESLRDGIALSGGTANWWGMEYNFLKKYFNYEE